MARHADGNREEWLNLRTVTPIRRFFAHVIDQLVLAGVVLWQFINVTQPGSPEQVLASSTVLLILLVVYLVLFTKGKTLGKWLLGIKIIKNNGKTAGFGTVVMRDIFGKLLSSVFYLGFFWILLDSRNQGWHDKLMGTTVVYAKEHKALAEGNLHD